MHDLEYAKQLLQYAIQVRASRRRDQEHGHGGPATLTNIAGDLNELASVVQGGHALAYSLGNQDVSCFGRRFLAINRGQALALDSHRCRYLRK